MEQGASATNAIFATGTPVEIYACSDLLVSGFVNSRSPKFSALDAIISIAGRSKGQDHIDSSAMHETEYFAMKDAVDIGNALGIFGSKFTTNRQLDKLEYYQLTPGDTVFNAVEDLCRDEGMTLCGQPNGDILITDATQSDRHAGGLYEGVNIEEAEGTLATRTGTVKRIYAASSRTATAPRRCGSTSSPKTRASNAIVRTFTTTTATRRRPNFRSARRTGATARRATLRA